MRLSRQARLAAPLTIAALLAGCSASSPGQPSPTARVVSTASGSHAATTAPATTARATTAAATTAPASTGTTVASATPRASAALPVAPGAGALPQTRALPSPDSAAFSHAMTDLWLAVTTGNPRFGLPAFFPLDAYKQVKAIPYPAADWQDRLWYDFTLDVGAAHRLVGPGARLARVIVPMADAVWVGPGACYNSVGYWHVSGARVVYTEHGQERSFGIASLISWRGVWYVVHLGEVLRPVVTGVVDQPAVGPGVPGPPGGC